MWVAKKLGDGEERWCMLNSWNYIKKENAM